MGVMKKGSSCSTGEAPRMQAMPGNPDPRNYRIRQSKVVGKCVILEVAYPDAKNYEGRKILVYLGTPLKQLKRLTELDPHFCDKADHPSPIARFLPTPEGWAFAVGFAEMLRDA